MGVNLCLAAPAETGLKLRLVRHYGVVNRAAVLIMLRVRCAPCMVRAVALSTIAGGLNHLTTVGSSPEVVSTAPGSS